MDAEERFHKKRMGYVKYYISMKHNVPLESINTNWTMKYVSINGQIVVKTVQSGNLKYIKCQDAEAEVEQMQQCQTKKTSQRFWAVVRRDLEEEKKDGQWVVNRRFHCRETKKEAGTKKMEDLRGRGGGRLKHRTIDGDVPLCLRKTEKDSGDDSSGRGKKREENESGSSTLSKTKHCVMNKMASGSKDMCPRSTGKEMTTQKTKRLHSLYYKKHEVNALKWKIEEMVSDLEGYRWDAILLNETWRHEQAEIWGHSINTFSWDPENSTTNTELELCWSKGGGKESSTLSTSTNVPSLPRYWWTDNTSNWWVCTFLTQNMRIITLRRCTKQSRNTWRTITNIYQSLEETSMLSWDLEKERNVKVWADTLSTRVTKEVTGWKAGWCYKITPPSTRCSGKHLRNKRPSFLQKEKTNWLHTHQEKMLETHQRCRGQRHDPHGKRPQMLLLSRSPCLERILIIKIWRGNTTRLNVKEFHKLQKASVLKCPSSKKYQEIVETL